MQPSRGIDDHDVALPGLAGGNGIEHHGGWIRAGAGADDVHAGAIRPDFELLDRGRSKRIRSADQRCLARILVKRASLPTVVVLPVPFTPTTITTCGA